MIIRAARRMVVGAALYITAVATFERLAPRRWVRRWQRLANPLLRPSAGWAPGWAVIETTGRRTGRRRRTPVGSRLKGSNLWVVAGDGRSSQWVLNAEADPRVRVQVHGRWRSGRAQVLADDDARRRLLRMNPLNSLFVGIAGTDLLTVRIDLDAERILERPLELGSVCSAQRRQC